MWLVACDLCFLDGRVKIHLALPNCPLPTFPALATCNFAGTALPSQWEASQRPDEAEHMLEPRRQALTTGASRHQPWAVQPPPWAACTRRQPCHAGSHACARPRCACDHSVAGGERSSENEVRSSKCVREFGWWGAGAAPEFGWWGGGSRLPRVSLRKPGKTAPQLFTSGRTNQFS